jgi:hypothetical protein
VCWVFVSQWRGGLRVGDSDSLLGNGGGLLEHCVPFSKWTPPGGATDSETILPGSVSLPSPTIGYN